MGHARAMDYWVLKVWTVSCVMIEVQLVNVDC